MKYVWVGREILRLRFKAVAAWRLFWSQGQFSPAALRFRQLAELSTGAANALEALEKIFGVWLTPSKGGAR